MVTVTATTTERGRDPSDFDSQGRMVPRAGCINARNLDQTSDSGVQRRPPLEEALAHGDVLRIDRAGANNTGPWCYPIPGITRLCEADPGVRRSARHRRDTHHLDRPARLYGRIRPDPRLSSCWAEGVAEP